MHKTRGLLFCKGSVRDMGYIYGSGAGLFPFKQIFILKPKDATHTQHTHTQNKPSAMEKGPLPLTAMQQNTPAP